MPPSQRHSVPKSNGNEGVFHTHYRFRKGTSPCRLYHTKGTFLREESKFSV